MFFVCCVNLAAVSKLSKSKLELQNLAVPSGSAAGAHAKRPEGAGSA